MPVPPDPIPIYRIMHIRNLAGVVANGQLFCENQRQQGNRTWQSIAHENIQERRRIRQVSCGSKGNICDYVPWYYAPRSPMLYAHRMGNVPSNTEGQKPIIYFRSTVQRVVEAKLPFVFTDGHAIMFNSHFFNNLSDLESIDWPLMKATYWRATDDDPERPRRRQAEFLVYQRFPFSLVEEIVVFDRDMLAEAQNCLLCVPNKPIIQVNKSWYFQ